MNATDTLVLRQQSIWMAFPYVLIGPLGSRVGTIDWPMADKSSKSAGGLVAGAMPMTVHGITFRVRQQTLPGGWRSDRRLLLLRGDVEMARLDICGGGWRSPAVLRLHAPVRGELRPARGWWRLMRMHDDIVLEDGRRGTVGEPYWISLRRELQVKLPAADDALRAFLGLAVLLSRTSRVRMHL